MEAHFLERRGTKAVDRSRGREPQHRLEGALIFELIIEILNRRGRTRRRLAAKWFASLPSAFSEEGIIFGP